MSSWMTAVKCDEECKCGRSDGTGGRTVFDFDSRSLDLPLFQEGSDVAPGCLGLCTLLLL